MSTKKHPHVETFIDELYKKVKELIDKAGGVGRIKGIG
jgi:glucokinase